MKMGNSAFCSMFIWAVLTMCLIICLTEAFDPVDNYLIDCGSGTNTSVDGRIFAADTTPSSLLSAPLYVFGTTTVKPEQIPSASPDVLRLHETAIILPETSKYTFPIRQKGRHWIRFYFFPVVYGTYDPSCSTFSVSAQNHLLLSNFSPSNTSTFKEFSLNVTSDTLVLNFVPSDYNSFAFVNALEVVSVPDKLIGSATVRSFSSQTFSGLSSYALETVVHVNIGGPAIPSQNDTLRRTWLAGQSFQVIRNRTVTNISNVTAVKYVAGGPTEDDAMATVYGTATILNKSISRGNDSYLQWEFKVDQGFQYLVRYHFCAITSDIQDKLLFSIQVNNWLVSPHINMSATATAFGAPYYLDVVTDINRDSSICISIGPYPATTHTVAILNGLEIMKLNNSLGNLCNAIPKSGPSQPVIVGVAVLVAVLSSLLAFFCITCRRRGKPGGQTHWKAKVFNLSLVGGNETACGKVESSSAIRFPFVAVEKATNNFDETWVIGVGGFGKVYKGVLRDSTKVAVKRSNPRSLQGLAEFRTEIALLSQFRHRHLVSLIGYCDERNEMVLIYEFMENGTLKSHLYGSNFPTLGWKERLEICIGAARGLHYLHTGCVMPVIHRDVKSSNILLDESLVARVADFGLSKTILENGQTHVSTAVRGTFGYFDPEYFSRRRLTTKSDVYSFGVVLLEVLSARPALDESLNEDMDNLAQWAMKHHKAGQLEKIIDPNLIGGIMPDSLMKFVETAETCLAGRSADRPTIEEVLFNLEHALQLQRATLEHQVNPGGSCSNGVIELSTEMDDLDEMDASATSVEESYSSRAND